MDASKDAQQILKQVDAYIELARTYSDKDELDKAEEIFEMLINGFFPNIRRHPFCMTLDEMEDIESLKLKAKLVFFYAIQCRRQGKYEACLRIYDIAFLLHGDLEKTDFYTYRALRLQIQINISFVHDEMGNFDKANEYSLYALSALIAMNKSVEGRFSDTISNIIGGLEKLYQKYDKPEKIELLKTIVHSEKWDNLDDLQQNSNVGRTTANKHY